MQRPAKICEKMRGTSKKLKIPLESLRDTYVKQNALWFSEVKFWCKNMLSKYLKKIVQVFSGLHVT
jgi:hypothetical protein